MKKAMNQKQIDRVMSKIIDAYNKNRDKIREAFPRALDPLKEYTAEILGDMEVTGRDVKSAIKHTFRTGLFMPRQEYFVRHFFDNMRQYERDSYEIWRKYIRHQKVIYENFKYRGWNEDGTAQIYTYDVPNKPGRVITIYVTVSPQQFQITKNW